MLKLLPLLCLAALAQGQDDVDLNLILVEIFGTTPPSAVPTEASAVDNKNQGPSTLVPLVKPQPSNGTQDLTCTLENGVLGECVAYYLCNTAENNINTDGIGVIDLSQKFREGPCLSYMDICCPLKDKRPPTDPVTPKPEPSEPTREGCGWRNPRGVGIRTTGDVNGETKFAEFPWMCAILKIGTVNDNEPDGQKVNIYIGGGSLIHPSVVLTAAHYVAAAPALGVRAGEWDTQIIHEPFPHQDREVASKEIHKDFNKDNLFYDIALLFLSKPMELAPNVQPACLPPPRQRVPANERCFVTGWGKDKDGRFQVIMKKIELPVVDRSSCQTRLRGNRLGRFFELHSSFMCAGGEKYQDACRGDRGSPLSCPIQDEPGRFAQAGIVAWWGIGCGEDGVPGVFVDVGNLRSWIDEKVAGKGYDPKVYSYLEAKPRKK